MGEDSHETSQAGVYESILNVDPKNFVTLTSAINKVIKSYEKKGNFDKNNQILIHKQSNDIQTSGVLFSRTADTGSPYFVINFEEGENTTGVTQGLIGNNIKIFRDTQISNIPKKWKSLIKSIKEIEEILKIDSLDIEFGIKKNNDISIFQVRPLTSISSKLSNLDLKKINLLITKNKKNYLKLQMHKKTSHLKTIFSDMSDWNPSEIIGNNPKPLDYSLYEYIIMKDAWHIGRSVMNYQNVKPYNLMMKFGNKPYVDIRGSFNSLIPNNINFKMQKKLLDFYLNKLESHPFLYDKVEFSILFTCFDLTIDLRLNELLKNNFTRSEISILKKKLLEFTNDLIDKFPQFLIDSEISIQKLIDKNQKMKSVSKSKNHKEIISTIENLLNDCKTYGTIPFSTMARFAFISNTIMKSLVKNGNISEKFVDEFMSSLSTPLTDLQNDIHAFSKQKISKNQFLKKYGHLRPGTYDITASRYDQDIHFFEKIKFVKSKNSTKININKKINSFIKSNGLVFSKIDFIDFFKQSVTQRERLKFQFTKNLSDSIDLITHLGNLFGFSKEDLSYLNINIILKSKNLTKNEIKKIWKKKIDKEKSLYILNNHLFFPPIISSIKNFDIIQYHDSRPNYITNKKIIKDLLILKNFKNIPNLKNKIILIENADPGYDWILTQNPSGLITKYGGIASHMAIRCGEIKLPAAIGCGEMLYQQLLSSSRVMLDCKNEEILSMQQNKLDTVVESRKILKSLGYIK